MHNGVECFVRVMKPGGQSTRVVLEPVVEPLEKQAAKFAIKVKPGDKVELPEGVEAPDHVGDAIVEVLGGVLLATVDDEGEFECPPIDEFNVMSHLRILHGVELKGLPITSSDELLRIHNELHAAPFHEPRHPHVHPELEAA